MDIPRYQPIENYAVIGDLRTVALVGLDASIDFMCFPRFDSPTIFAALLDADKGGRWKLAPQINSARRKQLYLPDSNVLLTRFLSAEGVAEISDFMPIGPLGHMHDLVRRAKTVRGSVLYRMIFEPRFNYARSGHRIEQHGSELRFISDGPDATALRLRADVPMTVREGGAYAEFELGEGESATFIMEELTSLADSPSLRPNYAINAFKETLNYWRAWVRQSTYRGRWREMVNRSALTLKLLVSQPHGSIVASPTFGLPEVIGGSRNWDYRYTWIRDASFTLYALSRLGYQDEAGAFMNWVEERCSSLNSDGSLKIMYGIDGRPRLEEFELPHLEGYLGSKPVRVGNAAYDQLQLDIYGELMDAIYIHDRHGRQITYDMWVNVVRLVDWVCANWERPDEGIWEIRSGRHEFLFSRLMCWVAIDRGLRLARNRSLPAPVEKWTNIRNAIHEDIMRQLWDPQRGYFVIHKGGTTLDAASLLMPLVRFISPTDPRWLATLAAIEKYLVDDSLVFRYQSDEGSHWWDGLQGAEGTFCMCSFWFVECLSRSGDLDKARFIFEKMLGYANHVGLYAEELGPAGEHLGNFPQALTHIALISAAFDLDRRLTARGWE